MALNSADLERLRRQIADHTFLVGTRRRRAAARQLAASPYAPAVPLLIQALADDDAQVKAAAHRALASLSDPSAIDALCETLISEDRPGLAALARERAWAPADASRRCLFLLLTDQIEACCEMDPECEHLRAEYAQADEALRRRIREKVLACGDDRLVRALSGSAGLDVTIAIHERSRNCAALFSCLESASYRQIVRILDFLAAQRWQPADEADRLFLSDLQALRSQILGFGDARADFEGLLTDPSLDSMSLGDLRQLAEKAHPSRRAAALLALASRDGGAAAPVVADLLTHTSWELRLAAALAAPLCGSGVSGQALAQLLDDHNHWVASGGVQGLIQGLRGFGSVEDLHRLEEARTRAEQRLRAAPGQAEQASLVLQLLLTVLRRSIRDIQLSLAGAEASGDFDIEIIEGGP